MTRLLRVIVVSLVPSWVVLVAVLSASSACTEPVSRTQVTVVIDADESVRADIRYVEVEVRSGSPNANVWDVSKMATLMPLNGTKSWPLRLALVSPERQGKTGYLVTATAKSPDDESLAIVRARSEYVEGKSLELRLEFDEACMKRTQLCGKTFSCRQGQCIDPFVPASELPTITSTSDSPAAPSQPVAATEPEASAGVTPGHSPGTPPPAAACTGSTCPSSMCAARDDDGVCLPCPPGFTGDDAKRCSPALISLALSDGSSSPSFDPQVTDYSIDLPLLAEHATLTFSAPAAVEVLINGRAVESKTEWTTPPLQFGANDVIITLNADGYASRTYTLTLKRKGEQLAMITPPYPSPGDAFGWSLSISGDLVLVGAPYEDGSEHSPSGDPDEQAKDSGAAYLFERTAAGWTLRAYLKAESPLAGAHFGYNLAIEGKRFAIGAPLDADGGSVYVYEYGADGVQQLAILKGDSSEGSFGRSIAIQKDRLVIGSPGDSVGAREAGSVYVYDYAGGSWQRSAILRSETPGTLDYLGSSVALDGDLVVSGATARTVMGQTLPSGVVYVFERGKDSWKQAAMLSATPVVSNAFFGESVAITGTTVATGGFFADLALSPGSAYVFTRGSDGQWAQQQVLQPTNSHDGNFFGERVSFVGTDLLMISASHEDSAMPGIDADGSGMLDQSGAVYLFSHSSGTWKQLAEVKASEPLATQEFGIGFGVSNGTFVAGTPSDPDRNGSSMKPGGVLVFK